MLSEVYMVVRVKTTLKVPLVSFSWLDYCLILISFSEEMPSMTVFE